MDCQNHITINCLYIGFAMTIIGCMCQLTKCLCCCRLYHVDHCCYIQYYKRDLFGSSCMAIGCVEAFKNVRLRPRSQCSMISKVWGLPMVFKTKKICHVSFRAWLERQEKMRNQGHILSLHANIFCSFFLVFGQLAKVSTLFRLIVLDSGTEEFATSSWLLAGEGLHSFSTTLMNDRTSLWNLTCKLCSFSWCAVDDDCSSLIPSNSSTIRVQSGPASMNKERASGSS